MKIRQALKSKWGLVTSLIFIVIAYFKFQIIAVSLGYEGFIPDIAYFVLIGIYGFIFGLGLERLFKG